MNKKSHPCLLIDIYIYTCVFIYGITNTSQGKQASACTTADPPLLPRHMHVQNFEWRYGRGQARDAGGSQPETQSDKSDKSGAEGEKQTDTASETERKQKLKDLQSKYPNRHLQKRLEKDIDKQPDFFQKMWKAATSPEERKEILEKARGALPND